MAKHHHPWLHLVCKERGVDIEVPMGDGGATPTAGFSAAEVITREGQRAMTAFGELPPFQQEVPVFLDGYSKNNSVQREHDEIMQLGGEAIFTASGPIFRPGRRYIFGGEPEYGEMIRAGDGTLLRCALTLQLMEWVPAGIRATQPKPQSAVGKAVAVGGTYTVRPGDTLTKIAVRLWGESSGWRTLKNLNGITDPNRELTAGQVLRV